MSEATAMIDLDDPPVDAPQGCTDPLMWRLARDLFAQHRRNHRGDCVTCPRWKVCPGPGLARDGLATALGMKVKESAYWIAYTSIMASPKRTPSDRM